MNIKTIWMTVSEPFTPANKCNSETGAPIKWFVGMYVSACELSKLMLNIYLGYSGKEYLYRSGLTILQARPKG